MTHNQGIEDEEKGAACVLAPRHERGLNSAYSVKTQGLDTAPPLANRQRAPRGIHRQTGFVTGTWWPRGTCNPNDETGHRKRS